MDRRFGRRRNIHTFDPFHLPFLNTMILLLSGTTVTWAHHCLLEGDRKGLVRGLGLTILLGLSFTLCQAIEYSHAPFAFNGGGVYPSVFFLATGFHGFHVIVGTCFLIVCWFRARGRPIHAGAAFWLRGGGLVLALRRRGVAVPVRLHLLVRRGPDRGRVNPTPWPNRTSRSFRRPCGAAVRGAARASCSRGC